jgi:hypothetical protein
MDYASPSLNISQSAPWWALPAATLAGVLITVAATVTLELLRARRDREARLFDARRETYTSIATLVRRQMALLNHGFSVANEPHEVVVPEEARKVHREAESACLADRVS